MQWDGDWLNSQRSGVGRHQSTPALSSTMQSVPMHKFKPATVQTESLHRNHSAPCTRNTTVMPPIFLLRVCVPYLSVAHPVIRHSHTSECPLMSRASYVRSVAEKLAGREVLFPLMLLPPASIIPPLLRSHIILDTTLIRRTSGRCMRTLRSSSSFYGIGKFITMSTISRHWHMFCVQTHTSYL